MCQPIILPKKICKTILLPEKCVNQCLLDIWRTVFFSCTHISFNISQFPSFCDLWAGSWSMSSNSQYQQEVDLCLQILNNTEPVTQKTCCQNLTSKQCLLKWRGLAARREKILYPVSSNLVLVQNHDPKLFLFSCPGQLNKWQCRSEPTNNQSLGMHQRVTLDTSRH